MQTPTTGPAKEANTSMKNDFAAMTLTLHDKFYQHTALETNALLIPFKPPTEISLKILSCMYLRTKIRRRHVIFAKMTYSRLRTHIVLIRQRSS